MKKYGTGYKAFLVKVAFFLMQYIFFNSTIEIIIWNGPKMAPRCCSWPF